MPDYAERLRSAASVAAPIPEDDYAARLNPTVMEPIGILPAIDQTVMGAGRVAPQRASVRTPADINANSKVSVGLLYRGTEAGRTPQTALRKSYGGDLGDGVYMTQEEWLAATYGGGPKASVKAGTRMVHKYEPQGDFYPEEVGYVFGGTRQGDPLRLVSGNGIPLWEGEWHGSGLGSGKGNKDYEKAAEGLKVIIGTPDSIGLNQVVVRDLSILKR